MHCAKHNMNVHMSVVSLTYVMHIVYVMHESVCVCIYTYISDDDICVFLHIQNAQFITVPFAFYSCQMSVQKDSRILTSGKECIDFDLIRAIHPRVRWFESVDCGFNCASAARKHHKLGARSDNCPNTSKPR
eukprot:s1610_g1.t1